MPYKGPEKRYILRHHVTCISVMFKRKRLMRSMMTDSSRPCQLSDINWRGMRFYSPRKLSTGSVIEVSFDCPLDVESSDGAGAIRARIAWQQWSTRHRAWRTGVQFVNVRDKTRDGILRMIDSAVEHEQKFRGDQDIL